MKRPPGIWFLLSIGFLWLSLENVCGLRATSLFFSRSPTTTTTTTTTTTESSPETGPSRSNDSETESSTEMVSNVTKPTLTGIPQIDYIYDPNLPKELNGYNLSEYPFYERVPEDIDFKCDGLHDGFYASVLHKCQVYHHCLFGTRYDFLCANYTAFDQKTFICHFVSEVDCLNSKKYWHRNDALYQATTTTTQKPIIVYTPKPPIEDSAQAPVGSRRPLHRRPLRRGRPQYDYYEYEDEYDDDYYEDRPRLEGRRRKKRPRPRPRPIYEEDYEEYEDDRYERRGGGRRRPQSTRRRNKDRRKFDDYDEDVEEEDRRHHKRRPSDDLGGDEERRRSRPKGSRRPIEDDYEDELPQNDRSSPATSKESTDDKAVIKPISGSSIYDRPRTAPRIKPPVPKSEANKFAYKPMNSRPTATDDSEYYDDYEEEVVSVKKNHRKAETSESKRYSTRLDEEASDRRKSPPRNRQSSREDYEEPPRRPHNKNRPHSRNRNNSNKRQPVVDEYYDDYLEDEAALEDSKTKLERPREKSTTTTTTTTTREPFRERPESIVRVVKRPFMPSRGGNPLSARGLQPVGSKASDRRPDIKQETTTIQQPELEIVETVKPIFKSSTIRGHFKFNNDNNRDFNGPRTTQKPKLAVNQDDPLDIIDNDDEYDVTLNDALNPTIPNLPVRSFPTGFSNAGYQQHQQRYVVDPVLNPSSSDYVYQQTKPNTQNHYVDNKGQFSTITRQNYPPRVTQAYYTGYN